MRVLALLLLAGCAFTPPAPPVSPRQLASVHIGHDTKASVAAALGSTPKSLAFDNGYEIWVYSVEGRELVLLFNPQGILSKARGMHISQQLETDKPRAIP